jgi:hypothetical protein
MHVGLANARRSLSINTCLFLGQARAHIEGYPQQIPISDAFIDSVVIRTVRPQDELVIGKIRVYRQVQQALPLVGLQLDVARWPLRHADELDALLVVPRQR